MAQSSSSKDGLKVLCVGLACLDSVYVVNSYPIEEDTKEKAISHRWHRGGNAANSSTVLALLGANTEYFGTLSSTPIARFLLDDFAKWGVNTENCVMYDEYNCPVATIFINKVNGSRTIIHNDSELPEPTLEEFRKLDLSQYSWIHFEGRNANTVAQMSEEVIRWNSEHASKHKQGAVRISVELERPRQWLDEILAVVPAADIVFVSKDFAHFMGWQDVDQTLTGVTQHARPGATIIATWGEQGAVAREPDGSVVKSPGFPPEKVVDTLAAGDTFVGAAIFSLNSGHTLLESITFACQIAGAKVGMYGMEGLKEVHRKLLSK